MKQSKKQPKVSLVGAGPGSVDLITIRGLRTLRCADVVLYDALVSKELLKEASPQALKIYVGKRGGQHSKTQEEINQLLVEYAYSHGHVIRLKGGDPFVFGRASEEIDYVASFGISVDVVPGISSAIAVPSSQGIPVTKRGSSSSFWVITATKKNEAFSKDLVHAARSSATMVILMGVRKIKEIAHEIRQYRSGFTPLALIQNGTLQDESCHTCTLNNIDSIYDAVDVSKPGIIVVGDVVSEHPSFFGEEVQRLLNF